MFQHQPQRFGETENRIGWFAARVAQVRDREKRAINVIMPVDQKQFHEMEAKLFPSFWLKCQSGSDQGIPCPVIPKASREESRCATLKLYCGILPDLRVKLRHGRRLSVGMTASVFRDKSGYGRSMARARRRKGIRAG